jgi:hypothetical protein
MWIAKSTVLEGDTVLFVNFSRHNHIRDLLCGLVVRVLGYRSGGPGSIPGTTRKKVVGLQRGPLSLVSTTEELLDRKVGAPVYKTENTAVGIRPQKLAITSSTSGGRSVGIVRSRTQTREFFLIILEATPSKFHHFTLSEK